MTKARAKPPAAPPVPVPAEPPAPAAVIADTVPADAICLLVGLPASGRSSTLAEWAAAVATGAEWNGHPVERRRVVYADAARAPHGQEPRDIADMIEAAGAEVSPEWLRVLPARVALTGADLGPWLSTIRSFGPGLVVLDALVDLDGPCGGLDHPDWATAVSTFAQGLYDATADHGAVVIAHECDVRGKPAGAPLGDGVDVVLRLAHVGGRTSVRPVGPARSGRRRAAAPAPLPPLKLEPMPSRGNWADGVWVGGYSPI